MPCKHGNSRLELVRRLMPTGSYPVVDAWKKRHECLLLDDQPASHLYLARQIRHKRKPMLSCEVDRANMAAIRGMP